MKLDTYSQRLAVEAQEQGNKETLATLAKVQWVSNGSGKMHAAPGYCSATLCGIDPPAHWVGQGQRWYASAAANSSWACDACMAAILTKLNLPVPPPPDYSDPDEPAPTPGAPLAAPSVPETESACYTCHDTGLTSYRYYCAECDAGRIRYVDRYMRETDPEVRAHMHQQIRETMYADAFDHLPPAVPCDHPADAVKWNPYNQVVQCHCCGRVFPQDGPPDPQTPAAREAAQRADEAELQAGLLATLPPMAGGSSPTDTTIANIHTYREGSVGVRLACGHQIMLATEANLSVGQPWSCPRCPQARPLCVGCNHEYEDHVWMAGEDRCGAWINGTESCACPRYSPPMAGGAPTPADEPAGPGATLERPDNYHGHTPGAIAEVLACDTCGPLLLRIAHHSGWDVDAPPTEHTHPCPTCHHDRACACSTFAPGTPLECATCSNCRGW